MYISECPRFGTPFLPWTYQIVGMEEYKIGLCMGLGSTNGVSVKVENGVSDIPRETIYRLIDKYQKHSYEDPNWETDYKDWIILEPEDVAEMMNRSKRNFKLYYKNEKGEYKWKIEQ